MKLTTTGKAFGGLVALGVLLILVLGVRSCSRSGDVNQVAVQQATTTAATAIVAKATVDTALSQHAIDSIVSVIQAAPKRATAKHATSLAKSATKLIAIAEASGPPGIIGTPQDDSDVAAYNRKVTPALDTAQAAIDSLSKQVVDLEADTTALRADNHRLASAAEVASHRLTQDTTVILPPVIPRKFLGISLPSLKKLLPSVTVQKDLVRIDAVTGKPNLALTSFSVGVGYTIRL